VERTGFAGDALDNKASVFVDQHRHTQQLAVEWDQEKKNSSTAACCRK